MIAVLWLLIKAGFDRLEARRQKLRWQSGSELWETEGMKNPELIDTGWLGPRSEMDRASHRFGKCSECHKIICVEKAVTDGPSTHRETSKTLDQAFRNHVEMEHSNQD